MGWTAEQLPDLNGCIAVVTGANSGIGWQAAYELAGHGARVVLACRDVERGKQAADRIRGRLPSADVDVDVAELNLSSFESVQAFTSGWSGRLDLLINNAGVMAPPRRAATDDGFELQFGVNHLGHFVLTGLLLPALLAADHPRVVTVASIAHKSATAAALNANVGPHYVPRQAYANSKLANLLFALELQRRAAAHGLALTSTAAHPGLAATGLVSDPEGMGATPVRRILAPAALRLFTQSAAAGARALLYAAEVAEPAAYIGPQRLRETRGPVGPARLSGYARDAKLGYRLWQTSEELTGFRYPWPA